MQTEPAVGKLNHYRDMAQRELADAGTEKKAPRSGKAGWGDTPLHAACGNGMVGPCKLLAVRKGNRGNPLHSLVSDRDGATPLMRACESGSVGCIEVLVAAGADVNALNSAGQSALYIA